MLDISAGIQLLPLMEFGVAVKVLFKKKILVKVAWENVLQSGPWSHFYLHFEPKVSESNTPILPQHV